MIDTLTWRDKAQCVGYPEAWFDLDSPEVLLEAGEEVCADCPVKFICLVEAGRRDDYGVLRGGVRMENPARTGCCWCEAEVPRGMRFCSYECSRLEAFADARLRPIRRALLVAAA